jgi:putative ATP-dependent endonuclease of OLD family
MRISKICIHNYRSIESSEIEPSAFSVFVGQNNHGKTNMFQAIDWFYSSAKSTPEEEHFDKDSSRIISVELFYEDVVNTDIEKLVAVNATKIRLMLDGGTAFSVKKTSEDHKKHYFVAGVDRGNPSGLDTAVNEFLPKLEYVTTKIRLADVSQYKDSNPIGKMLSGVLATIVEHSPEYVLFQAQFTKLFEDEDSEVREQLNKLGDEVSVYLKKQFPGDVEVSFKVNPPQFNDLLKSFDTTVDDGVVTKAEDKGEGMQRAIMLSIIQAFADFRREQTVGTSFLFLIDEAELHLHPSAQRLLKRALIDISDVDQIMINTHSSVLVVDEHPQQKIFRVEKEDRKTSIIPVGVGDKMDIVFDLLGGSPSDLLLPRNFLIVEGKSEFELLTNIIKNHYVGEFDGIKILFAGGDTERQSETIDAVDKTLRPLVGTDHGIYKDKLVVLLDLPNSSQTDSYATFKTGYPYLFDSGRVFVLPFCTLEEYYPNPWTKTASGVKEMSQISGEKTRLAKEVASGIQKSDFESQMSVIYNALMKCREESF